MTGRVAVVGGGLAGITAALRCADAGQSVVLLEARGALGGLTHSFRRGNLDVDNGQHVFLRCCTSYRNLLERLGVSDLVQLQRRLDIGVRTPDRGRAARLQRTGLPAPLHLAGSLTRYSVLSPADRLRAVRGALAMRRLDLADGSLDQETFGDWLTAHGQNSRTVAALWDLFAVATLNASAAAASLGLAAMVFQTGLLTDPGAGDIGWSRVPLQQLHGDAAVRSLEEVGAEVRTRAKVEVVTPSDTGGWLVGERDGQHHEVDQVVLACPPTHTESLLPPDSLDLDPGWSSRLGSSPIVNVHVVFDRQVLDEPFLAGVDTPAQWVFDRTLQSSLTEGQYVAVSVSAAHDSIDLSTAEIRDRMIPALEALLPAARGARVLDFFVTRERHATFNPVAGTARSRPSSATRHPGLALAGAWTATGWPATMESAVRSGEAAAATLLHDRMSTEKKGVMAV